MNTDQERISLRVEVPAGDETAVMEMTGPVVPENGLQAFGDWVLAAGASTWPGTGLARRRRLLRP